MLDKDTIRSLIRDVITQEVRHLKGSQAAPSPSAVTIASDADLAAFAKQVLVMAEDSTLRAAILAGSHHFSLARHVSAAAGAPHTPAPAAAHHRIEKGVVTESVIARLPKGVTRLELAAGVSITPLARDKARSRNISIERVGQ